MEKIMYALWAREGTAGNAFRDRLLQQAVPQLLEHVHRLSVMVVDEDVAAAEPLRIVGTKPAFDAMVSMWVDSATHREGIEGILAEHASRCWGYLVVESEPYPEERKRREQLYGGVVLEGERTPGMCQVVLLNHPPRLSYERWYQIWRDSHGPIAYPTQATFGYRQNTVVRTLTYGAAHYDAIVEENFVPEAMDSPEGFYAAIGDPKKRARHERMMMESCQEFIDMDRLDRIATSEYRLRR